jgi:hypothetical protein
LIKTAEVGDMAIMTTLYTGRRRASFILNFIEIMADTLPRILNNSATLFCCSLGGFDGPEEKAKTQ